MNSNSSSNTKTPLVAVSEPIIVKVRPVPSNEMATLAAQAIYDQLDSVTLKPLKITEEEIRSALVSFVILKTNPKLDLEGFRSPFLIPSFLYNILSKVEKANSAKVLYEIVPLSGDDYDRPAIDKLQRVFLGLGKSLPIAVESGLPKGRVKDHEVVCDMLTFRLKDGEQRPLDGAPHPEAWRQAVYLGLTHDDDPVLPEMSYGSLAVAKGYFHEVFQ